MNIFVLNTGRCGSMTFIRACEHITNYTAAHESRARLFGNDKLDYPENHIEADNRLSWFLGRLDHKYGDNAFYVHLVRNKDETSESYSKKFNGGIIHAYRKALIIGLPNDVDPLKISEDYYDTVNKNIELFLKDKTKKITIDISSPEEKFVEFFQEIHAAGDLSKSLAEFKVMHNYTKTSKRIISFNRILNKLKRIIFNLPEYIKTI